MRSQFCRRAAGLVLAVALSGTLTAAGVPATDPPATGESTGSALPETAPGAPPGATDGVPVGAYEEEPAGRTGESDVPTSQTAPAARASADEPKRHLGADVFAAVQQVGTIPRNCTISDPGVIAMTLAPLFKESGQGTTPESAPSPMTLSRYDEWNGTYSTSTNASANYGLYAFRDPYTPYFKAYWHPGVGLWQYDSAGLGAPFTAAERIDVATIALDLATGAVQRYCAAGGRANQPTSFYEAWRPWGYPCTLCLEAYESLDAGNGFSNLVLVDGISSTGGMQTRSCSLPGTGPFTCWYVDPALAEGADWWVTYRPDGENAAGQPDPTVTPAPLSAPFYVFERSGREERHWMVEDTGYPDPISATRLMGKNARPRSNQSGSGLTWSASSSLCDITVGRGSCVPAAIEGKSVVTRNISGTYRPVVADVDSDGDSDVLLYGPGDAADHAWLSNGDGTFSQRALSVRGVYEPLVGNFDGGAGEDVFWYAPGPGGDSVWYAESPYPDRAAVSHPVSGTYEPLVGDFDGDNRDDVYWYAPGSAPDSVWYGRSDRQFDKTVRPVSGAYEPLVGDFDGDGRDDVYWYAPGSAPDSVWYGRTGRSFDAVSIPVSGTYSPVVADLHGDGPDDIIWYAPGTAADPVWLGRSGRGFESTATRIDEEYTAFVGRFDTVGGEDVFWYAPGFVLDAVWRDEV